MKKIFTLLITLLLLTTVVLGQHYQFPNPTFDEGSWHHSGANGGDPYLWHSYAEGTGNLIGQSQNNGNSVNVRCTGKTNYGCCLPCRSKWIVIGSMVVNGSMTVGQVRAQAIGSIGSLGLSNENYNFDNSTYNWEFSGMPDSISIYACSAFKNAHQSYMKVVFHNGLNCYDRSTDVINADNSVVIWAKCVKPFTPNNFSTSADHTVTSSNYRREVFSVDYESVARPSTGTNYMLASFSTSTTVGGGNAIDKLYLDEFRCIYDKSLASLTIGGVAQPDLLAACNNAEFLTHYNLTPNNTGVVELDCSAPVCYSSIDDFPEIEASPRSSHILSIENNVDFSGAYPRVEITVTHNDYSTFTYIINLTNARQTPSAPAISGATSACDDGQVTLTANTPNAVWYRWGEQVGTGISYNATFNGQQSMIYEYQCKAFVDGCYSEAAQHSIAVEYVQTPTVSNPTQTNICGGGSTSISATGTNQLFYWLLDGNVVQSSSTAANSNSYTTTLNQPGTYNYYCYTMNSASSSCKSANVPVQTITVHPAVTTPMNIQNATACFGQPVMLSATPSEGAVCRWYAQSTGGTPLATGNTYSPNIESAGNYHFYVSSYNNTTQCESERAEVSATVNQSPAAPTNVSTPITLCGPGSVTLAATPAAGASLIWYAQTQTIGNTSPLQVSNIVSDTSFTVVSALNGCESSPVTVQVTMGAAVNVPTVTNNTHCGAGTVTLSASSNEGNIYWYANNTTQDALAQAVNTYDVNVDNVVNTVTRTYYVSARSQSGCASDRVPVTATFYALPTAPTTTPVNHCGAYENLTLSSTPNVNTIWYSDAQGEHELTGTNVDVATTTTYYVAVMDEHQCKSVLTPLTVNIHSIPGQPVTNTSVCKPAVNISLTAEPGENGTDCHWFTELNGTPRSNPYQITSAGTYYVTSFNGNCESEHVMVTVTNIPNAPSANDVALCAAGNATLAVQNPAYDLTYTWYADADLTQVIGTGSSLDYMVSQSGSYYVTAKRGGCESSAKMVVVTIKDPVPTPELASVMYACNGTATLPANYNSYSLIWKNVAQSVLQDLVVNVPESSSSVYTASYMIDNCESQSVSVTVFYAAVPSITNDENTARCGAGVVELSASAPNSTIYWFESQSAANAFTGVESALATGDVFSPSVNNTKTYYMRAVSGQVCLSTVASIVAIVNNNNDNLTVSNITNCGAGTFTLTASGSSNQLTWYADAQGENTVENTQEVSETTSFYVASTDANGCRSALKKLDVTINAIPAQPSVANVPVICGSGSVTLSATTEEANCHTQWYNASEEELSQGTYRTLTLRETTQFLVASINDATHCKSTKTPVTVVVGSIPAVPQVNANTNCGPGSVALSAVADNGCAVVWFADAATADSVAVGANFAPELSHTTTFYAVNKNQTTGCASTPAAVTATIFPVYTDVVDNQVACDEYVWEGDSYTTSGQYTKTLSTVNGCDSIVTLNLTIRHSATTHIDTTVCDQFVWNGQTYTESDVLAHTFTSSHNCDSVVTINLTVKKSTAFAETMTVCSNALPILYNGREFSQAGTYTVTIPNAVGCDSVITLTLVVNPQPAVPTVTNAVRCGTGTVTLIANRGANATECRWYADDLSSVALSNENRYQPSLSENTIYFVSSYNTNTNCESARVPVTATVNAIPVAPVISNQSRCGSGVVTLSAEIDDNATTCRWYRTASATTSLHDGLTYAPNVTAEQSFFVESYNANTNCVSTTRTEVTATVYDIPSVAVISPVSNCGPETFAVAKPTTGDYRWYDATMNPMQLQSDDDNYYTGLISQSSILKVTHIESHEDLVCESAPSDFSITIYPVYQPQTIFDTICQNTIYNNYGVQETFAQAGDYIRELNIVSSNGCDSIVNLSICVKPVKQYRFSHSECDAYTWNNIRYSQSGTYTQTFTAANGCDSVVTLDLTIFPSETSEFSASNCDSYSWNDQTYTQSGDYVQHFNTVNGCDSVVTLHLTIYNSVEQDIYETACNSYTWNNETYTSTGIYTQSFETVHHCDSIVRLHLTVNHGDRVDLYDVVCANTAYSKYGFSTMFTRSGDYLLEHDDVNVNGCDSTTILHLTVYPVYNENVSEVICATALPYRWRNKVIEEAGAYVFEETTVNGCDSIVTLNLSVSDAYVTNLQAHICQGEVYNQNGFDTAEPGVYQLNLTAHNGCDSVVILNLFVHDLNTTELSDAVCQNEAYSRYGFQNISTAEVGTFTYTQVVPTQYGCDSTVVLTLTVNPVYDLQFAETICLGERYNENGFDTMPQTAGVCTMVENLITANGCDSIRTLTLNVLPTYRQSLTIETCDNEPFQFGDTLLTQSTQYSFNFHTVAGCDSIVDLTLIVHPTFNQQESLTICENVLPYEWRDTVFAVGSQSGVMTFNRQTVNGCDSVVTLTLTVNPKYDVNDTVDFCQSNTTYNYHGSIIDFSQPVAMTALTVPFVSQYGCDSIFTLHYAVHPAYYWEETAETCDNTPYVWNGHNNVTIPTEAGEYVIYDSLHTAYGCDSVMVLNLTVKPVLYTTVDASICDGESYLFNGREYVRTGSYPVTLTSSLNCDSVVTLNLTVNPTYLIDTNIAVCQGALPYTFNGEQFDLEDNGTMRIVSLQTAAGCDSIFQVHFSVEAFNYEEETVTICDNQLPYAYQDSVFAQAGVYQVVRTEVDGCNTITTLTLNVNPTYLHFDTVYACANKLPYHYGSTLIAEAGTTTIHYSTPQSCDSTVVVTLVVEPNPTSTDVIFVCANDFPVVYGDSTINEAGAYTVVFARENECDSIVSLTVNEAPVYFNEETQTVCSYELPIVWHNQSLAAAGVYYDSLASQQFGCDSVYKLTLNVMNSMLYTETETSCEGETIEWRGRQLTQSGVYTDTVDNVETGCYDVYMMTATFNPSYHFVTIDTICAGQVYNWRGRTLTASAQLSDRLQTVEGCDSIYTLNLVVNPTYQFDTEVVVCDNELPVVWRGAEYNLSGVYYDSLQTAAGCDSVYTMALTVNPTYHFTDNMTFCQMNSTYNYHGEVISLAQPVANAEVIAVFATESGCDSVYTLTYTVNPVYSFEETAETCDNEPYVWNGHESVVIPTAAGSYQIFDSLQTANGCDSIWKLSLTVRPTYFIADVAETCDNVPFVWEGHNAVTIPTTAGSYVLTDTLYSVYGCDSICQLNLTVNPTYLFADTMVVCDNELPFVWRGMSLDAAGTRTVSLQTASGCDSIYLMTLIVNPTYHINEQVVICSSEAPYPWHGQNLSESGVFYDSLATANGCDSIYTLNLTVNPSNNYYDTAATCSNEPYTWRGLQLSTSGLYTDTIPNAYGCDDVYHLFLTVNQTATVTIYDTICQGDYYQQFGFDTLPEQYGVVYDQQLLQTENGCDSIVNLVLTVNRTYQIVTNAETCDNTPYEWRGHEYDEAGVYFDTLVSSTGCDSVLVLNLLVNPTYDIFVEDSAIRTHEYSNYGLTIIPNEVGDFTYDIQNYTVNGCDSIVHLTLHVINNDGVAEYSDDARFNMYPNPTSDVLNVSGENMQKVYVYNALGTLIKVEAVDDDTFTQIQLGGYATGYYLIRIQLADGHFVNRKIMVHHN